MDARLEKFAISADGIAAVEMAITRMVAKDVLDHEDTHTLGRRLGVLRDRLASENMKQYLDLVGPLGTGTEELLQALGQAVGTALETMSPLHRVLFLAEVQTAAPYAASKNEDTAKLSIGENARKESLRFAAAAATPLGDFINAEEVASAVEKAGQTAEDVHSAFFKNASKFLAGVIVAVVTGILAGPVIGGLVGKFVLGLSGAAAVSAGLALLGGGALAAGGFGMLGGSVVVAAAFGAAGAGASTMFMAEGGPKAARVAFTRHHMAFEALRSLKLLDHQLASDFLESTAQQLEHYKGLGANKNTEKSDAERARKVVDVIGAVHKAMTDAYVESTREGEIRHEPAAWTPKPVGVAVEDADFRSLMSQMSDRQETLENCLWVLENAKDSFADVVSSRQYRALSRLLAKDLTKDTSDGIAFVAEATRMIAELAKAQQDEMTQLANAMAKVEALQQESDEHAAALDRYQRATVRMMEAIASLRAERDALRAELARSYEEQQRAAAAALLAPPALTAPNANRQLKLGRGNVRTAGEALSTIHPSTREVELNALLGVLLGGSASNSLRSRTELERIMEAFGMPLGTPTEDVRNRRRDLIAAVHTDRIDDAPEAMKRAARQAQEDYELAAELHVRYAGLLEPRRRD